MFFTEVSVQSDCAGEFLLAFTTHIHHSVLEIMLLQIDPPAGGVVAQIAVMNCTVQFYVVDEQVTIAIDLFLEFSVADMTLMENCGTLRLLSLKLVQILVP